MFKPLIILFAFALGFTLTRASTCTVAATKRWVNEGRPDWFIGIAIAVCWSGITLLVLEFLIPGQVAGSLTVPIGFTLIVAAVIMGIGAYLNNGCFIGSVARISSGDTSYLMAFAGLVTARLLGELSIFSPLSVHQNETHAPMLALVTYWVLLAVFTVLAIYGASKAIKHRKQALIALCFMGVFAALTYASIPDWSYEAWIGGIVHGEGFSQNFLVELSILALFSGAITSSVLHGKFELRRPSATTAGWCFVGGVFMVWGQYLYPAAMTLCFFGPSQLSPCTD